LSAEKESEPRLADLEQAITQRVVERTGRQVGDLNVKIAGEQIVVGGRVVSFHIKQLAIHGVMDAIGLFEESRPLEVDMQIAVIPAGS
jgi:hypothetical protein